VAGVTGVVLEVVGQLLHPSSAQPNDSRAAFREYAASATWVPAHLLQWLGVLLVAVALVTVGEVLAVRSGRGAGLAVPGMLAAALVAAVFSVQMAVDGVALKMAVDTWAAAPADGSATAFAVADGIRDVEKGLSAFFHLLNGTALVLLGLAVALGRALPRWLGLVGALAGLGYLAGGVVTAYTGFSETAGTVLLAPLLLSAVFLLGSCVWMWRHR